MAKLILSAVLAIVLTACGGGSSDPAPLPPQAPAAVPPVCTPRTVSVALLGDSTQWGWDSQTKAVADHSPGVELQAKMDAQFGAGAVVVSDLAVSGSSSEQAPHVTADVIVANYGINDRGRARSLADYRASMLAIGATLIETQSPVWAEQAGIVQADYVSTSKALGLPVADVYEYVLSLPDWQSLVVDGVHPVDALYVKIVDNVLAPAVAEQVAPLRCIKG